MNSGCHRLKLLIVVTEDWYFWGHRLSLARAMRDLGVQVVVATAVAEFESKMKEERFDLYPLPSWRKTKNPLKELQSLYLLYNCYKSIEPDLIHHVALKPILYGSLAARLVGRIPIVNAVTGLGYLFSTSSKRKKFLQKLFKFAANMAFKNSNTRFIFENPEDLKLFRERRFVRDPLCRVILGSGVDAVRFSTGPEPVGPPTVLLPSRMLWEKGIAEAVEASRILRSRGLDFRIILAGRIDPDSPASIPEHRIRRWEAEGLIEWHGFVDNMPELYASCHIICLPTYYREGVPMTLIEAAACGRPLVSTDVAGCREIVRHGVNGLLVPAKDPVALADALSELIANPALRAAMGQKGRELVLTAFTKEMVIQKTFAVYRQLLGDKWPS